jgi:dihydroorotase-like cyclic amidohydrolase
MRSRSKNTPFDGWEFRGAVAATIVGGRWRANPGTTVTTTLNSQRMDIETVYAEW